MFSAKVLDRLRLGKQRVETLQVIKALVVPDYGWQNHPAVRMWRGYEDTLLEYQHAVCAEWTGRGYRDTCWEKSLDMLNDGREIHDGIPPWLGNSELHLSHQSNLVRKDPEHYGPLFPGVPDNMVYVWPEPSKVSR